MPLGQAGKVAPRRAAELFLRAEMESHLWTEALRRGHAGRVRSARLRLAAIRAEVSEEVLRNGNRCLQLGNCLRLVSGTLSGCVGIVVARPGRPLSLRIVRHAPAWEEAEYIESVH